MMRALFGSVKRFLLLFPASESYREMKNLPIMDSVG
jgi:hypothetical protein